VSAGALEEQGAAGSLCCAPASRCVHSGSSALDRVPQALPAGNHHNGQLFVPLDEAVRHLYDVNSTMSSATILQLPLIL